MLNENTQIKDLKIDRKIADGGMGEIFLGKCDFLVNDEAHSRQVVFKRMKKRNNQAKYFQKNHLVQEAQKYMFLRHENFPKCYGIYSKFPYEYLILEHVNGYSLREILNYVWSKQDKLEETFIIYVWIEVIKSLIALNNISYKGLGIIHRDITPHNIMVSMDGKIKLIDFGISVFYEKKYVHENRFIAGKPLYMSPEQSSYSDIDLRSDIYSLSITMYEALSRIPLIKKYCDLSFQKDEIILGLKKDSDISLKCKRILKKGLSIEKNKRFSSPKEMHKRIIHDFGFVNRRAIFPYLNLLLKEMESKNGILKELDDEKTTLNFYFTEGQEKR
ncbi:MAG: serine/threonine-protein kinase [Pseudomonadota bacterium]